MSRPGFGPVEIIPLFESAVEDDGLLSFEISRDTLPDGTIPAEALTYWVVADGDNPVDGDDFTSGALPNGVIVFEADQVSQVLHISLRANSFAEGDETFSLVIAPDPSMPASRGAGSIDVVVSDDGDPVRPLVFGFFNEDAGASLFTADQAEVAVIQENLPGFRFDDGAFRAAAEGDEGAVDVHRFFNSETGTHFFTADDREKAAIEENLDQFVYEGVAFQAFDGSSIPEGNVRVERLFDPESGVHQFTTDVAEREEAMLDGFMYEGTAFSAYSLIG